MTIAFSLIALVVLARTGWLLAEHSPSFRRFSLATAGVVQIALGMAAAGAAVWSGAAWAGDAPVAEAFETPSSTSAVAAEAESPRKSISVEPGKTVIIPPGRPEWVSADGAFNREPGSKWAAVVGGPCKTRTECEKELSSAVKQAADDYINFELDSQLAAKLLNYDGAELKSRLVAPSDVYGETIQVSFGPMEQLHAHVHFNDDFVKEIHAKWKDLKTKFRLGQIGVIGAVVLSLLSTAFGFFKANTATRGQRGSSLQFAAAATILVIVVAGVTAARYMHWF